MGRIDMEGMEALRETEKYIGIWGAARLIAYWAEEDGEFIVRPAVTSRGIDSAIVTKCSRQEIFEFCTKVGLRLISVKRFWWSDEIKEKSDATENA